MIKGLRISSIFSEDIEKLLPFYRDTVGLSVGQGGGDGFYVMGDANGPVLGLGTHSEVHGKATDQARHIVGFDTDDIQADFQRLKAAGVEFIEEPNRPGGDGPQIATFKDPEGNLIQLLQF